MRAWPDLAIRIVGTVALLAAGWQLGAKAVGPWRPLAGWIVAVPWFALLVLLALLPLTRVFYRRTGPAVWVGLEKPRAEIARDGTFTWNPAGQPLPFTRGPAIHHWWDLSTAPRAQVALAFEVQDEIPSRRLAKATAKALRSATAALPGRGKVRAKAAWRDLPGPHARVGVRLEVRGIGADESWARAASEAFAKRFRLELGLP